MQVEKEEAKTNNKSPVPKQNQLSDKENIVSSSSDSKAPEKPKEKEVSEDDIIKMMEKTIKEKSGGKYWNERRKCVLSSLDIKILAQILD